MAKTAIITRAFNRLEYTVTCVRETDIHAKDADYEHIVIEQNSSDGTKEWLKSLEIEGYYKLKVKYNTKNTGDAGGMKDGFDMISDDCKYILQLDNDLIPITDDFINKLVDIMDTYPKIGTLMLDITGVGNKLELGSLFNKHNGMDLYNMKTVHSMFYRRELLEELNHWIYNENIGWVKHIPTKLEKMGYNIIKVPDIKVWHIDTTSGQVKKYPKYVYSRSPVKGTNYKFFKYN